jgi:hypothetical protein
MLQKSHAFKRDGAKVIVTAKNEFFFNPETAKTQALRPLYSARH